MNLWKYLRDRAAFIIVYFINTGLVIVIMALDRLRQGAYPAPGSIAYAFLLSFFFIGILTAIDYGRKRQIYKVLNSIENNKSSLEDVFKASVPPGSEHGFFIGILKNSYMIYEEKLSEYKEKQKEHLHFINQWAHQMKTPISVINLILEDAGGLLSADKAESIREESEKLSHGLDMALYTARISDFEQDFKIEKVDIIQETRCVINEHKKEFIRYSIYPKIIADTNLTAETDAKWIRFVINQIISNSIKYSRCKDKKEILIEESKYEDGVMLSIKDKGVGIPPEDVKRVFQPFFTGANGRRFPESTGMGMYLSKVVCNKLGHNISIESEEGLWTKVTILFFKGRSLYNVENMTKL